MAGLFLKLSGLDKLIKQFPAQKTPTEEFLDKQTIQIGKVRFRRCVTVKVYRTGLYLQVQTVFSKYPPVLIPWREMQKLQPIKIYGRKATLLGVGTPRLTTLRLPLRLFDLIVPYLSPNGSV